MSLVPAGIISRAFFRSFQTLLIFIPTMQDPAAFTGLIQTAYTFSGSSLDLGKAVLDGTVLPEATVRTRFFRARSLLRESLASEMDTALGEVFAFDGARCDRIVASVLARGNAEGLRNEY